MSEPAFRIAPRFVRTPVPLESDDSLRRRVEDEATALRGVPFKLDLVSGYELDAVASIHGVVRKGLKPYSDSDVSAAVDTAPEPKPPFVTSDVIRALTEEARAFRRERGFIGPVVEFAQLAHMIAPRESGTRFLPQARLDLQQFVLLAEPDRIELLCRMIELGARHWPVEAQEAAGVEA